MTCTFCRRDLIAVHTWCGVLVCGNAPCLLAASKRRES